MVQLLIWYLDGTRAYTTVELKPKLALIFEDHGGFYVLHQKCKMPTLTALGIISGRFELK